MKLNEIFTLDEVNIDNTEGLGATGYNSNVDYRGLRVQMTPSTFLKLAHRLETPESVDYIVDYIKKGGAIGSPFLLIKIPDGWWDGDFSKAARVIGHEGRNRMTAIQKVEGNDPVEVHLFFYSTQEVRARHITPEIKEHLKKQLLAQDGNWVFGPVFESQQLLELFDNPYQTKWVKKTKNNTDAVFSTSDGTEIIVSFNSTDNMTTLGFEAKYFDKEADQTIVTFLATGRGDAPRIFATILAAIKKFVSTKKPDYLFFTSLEPSRTKLYNTMVRMLGSDYSRVNVSNVDNMNTTENVKRVLANYVEELPPDEIFILEKKTLSTLNEVISNTSSTYRFRSIYPNEYLFATDAHLNYIVLFMQDSFQDDDKEWKRAFDIQFGIKNFDDDEYAQTKLTKTGDAFKVLATIGKIIRLHMSREMDYNYIMFTALLEEQSRVKLYDAFIKLLPKFLPGWKLHKTKDAHGERQYIIKRTSADNAS